MRRPQLEAILADGKATNGGAVDFKIKVPLSEMPGVLTILKNLEAVGLVSGFNRRAAPEQDCVDVFGYTGP